MIAWLDDAISRNLSRLLEILARWDAYLAQKAAAQQAALAGSERLERLFEQGEKKLPSALQPVKKSQKKYDKTNIGQSEDGEGGHMDNTKSHELMKKRKRAEYGEGKKQEDRNKRAAEQEGWDVLTRAKFVLLLPGAVMLDNVERGVEWVNFQFSPPDHACGFDYCSHCGTGIPPDIFSAPWGNGFYLPGVNLAPGAPLIMPGTAPVLVPVFLP